MYLMQCCVTCLIEKPVDDFFRSNVGNPKYECKECSRKKSAARRAAALPKESECLGCGQTKLMEHMVSLTRCKDCRNSTLRKARTANKEPSLDEPTRICSKCNQEKPESRMLKGKSSCKDCKNEDARRKIEALTEEERRAVREKERQRGVARYAKNRERHGEVCKGIYERNKEHRKNRRLQQTYGITPERHAAMLEQQCGECAICKRKFDGAYPPFVDHNHSTGKVRELLCRSCNSAIGYANEDTQVLQRMIEYITKHNVHVSEVTIPVIPN